MNKNEHIFRSVPRTVQAFQLTPERIESNEEWPSWLHEAWNKDRNDVGALYLQYNEPRTLAIHTAEGPQTVTPNDWIINDLVGPLYPCKPDIFGKKYERP